MKLSEIFFPGPQAVSTQADPLTVIQAKLTAATALADKYKTDVDSLTSSVTAMTAEKDGLAANVATLTAQLADVTGKLEKATADIAAAKAAHDALEASIPERVKAEAVNIAAASGIAPGVVPPGGSADPETIDGLRAKLADATPTERFALSAKIRALRNA